MCLLSVPSAIFQNFWESFGNFAARMAHDITMKHHSAKNLLHLYFLASLDTVSSFYIFIGSKLTLELNNVVLDTKVNSWGRHCLILGSILTLWNFKYCQKYRKIHCFVRIMWFLICVPFSVPNAIFQNSWKSFGNFDTKYGTLHCHEAPVCKKWMNFYDKVLCNNKWSFKNFTGSKLTLW